MIKDPTWYVGDRSFWTRQSEFWPHHTRFSVGGGQSRDEEIGLFGHVRVSFGLNMLGLV